MKILCDNRKARFNYFISRHIRFADKIIKTNLLEGIV
jgi:hypothetical protein